VGLSCKNADKIRISIEQFSGRGPSKTTAASSLSTGLLRLEALVRVCQDVQQLEQFSCHIKIMNIHTASITNVPLNSLHSRYTYTADCRCLLTSTCCEPGPTFCTNCQPPYLTTTAAFNVLCLIDTTTSNVGHDLPSQSLSMLLMKLNLTQQNQTGPMKPKTL